MVAMGLLRETRLIIMEKENEKTNSNLWSKSFKNFSTNGQINKVR